MSNPRDPTSRLRAGLNPLRTTALGGFQNGMDTPLSAVSLASRHNNFYSAAPTPVSAIQPYNPQEWIGSPAASSERSHQFPPQEPQVSPPPPPPYSPPRSQRPVSTAFETPPANIGAARAPLPGVHRPSPEPAANTSFPPPPGPGGRVASRDRRFGLPPLSRRREPEQISPPEPQPPVSISRGHAGPLTLQIPTHIPQRAEIDSASGLPPGARRSVSTPAIATPTSARSRSTSQSRWEPGMPIPPPPPGPPPTTSRSQSMTRPETTTPVLSPPTRRPPPSGIAALGPVPPTPANWVEEDSNTNNLAREHSPHPVSSPEAPNTSSPSAQPEPSPGLARAGAVRLDKTIRERRSDSRTRSIRHSIDGSLELSDIVIPNSAGLSRRLTANRGNPRSNRSSVELQRSGESSSEIHRDSRNTTPRQTMQHADTDTPPFSPHPLKAQPRTGESPAHIAPKALPTPPPQSRSASSSQTRYGLVSAPPSATQKGKQAMGSQSADDFSRATVERFQAFAEKEATAANDIDRVRLFAEFIVSESRIRRERYSSAIGAMGSEIFDLTRDLFRPMDNRRDSNSSQMSITPRLVDSPAGPGTAGPSTGETRHEGPSSAPASAGVPMSPTGPPPNNGNYSSNYMPSLSPILSMSVSENYENGSSRGRPASRWWEADSAGDPSTRIERSKRESKYMGVTRESLQWTDGPSMPDSLPSSSQRAPSNEYPPEKKGWSDQEQVSTPQGPLRNSIIGALPSPNTPNPAHMDVSRLVTLPPPYPRHHPALNNNHPELTQIRNSVRVISDFAEVEATKARFNATSKKMRDEAAEQATKRRRSLRANLHQEVQSGNMSYAEAAAIETDGQEAENAKVKELERKDFEAFQAEVVQPLNDLLTSRIAKATALFEELRSRLFVENQETSPNMPQEEGDEQPELLEKLTLLKWIFEARELLHRAVYDLLSDRNDRYRDVVLTPYRLAGNGDKVASAEAFFAEDAGKRALAFAEEVLRRTQEFRDVVEENVVRGVEVQLSAFWDIAPPLKRLLDKIPAGLAGFRIQIPAAEFGENPSYVAHPMQYLFSLLLHAEKSTYQFIESQTNLLCLLHEVKEAVVGAKAKVMESDGLAQRVDEVKAEETRRLTDDLKEKVRVVEDQWYSALGDGFRHVKERVGGWLLETGGWDESLEDGGVGGA